MVEKSNRHYLRSFDINEKLLSSIDNGIVILDDELTIYYFNSWLEIHTSLKEQDVLDKKIYELFDNINIKTLKRKIKTALRMGTPTFYTATTSKYLIPIKINQLNVSNFSHMRQDVSVIPFDKEKNLIALVITDQTNIIYTNTLLEKNIQKVKELNSELIKERDTIDKKVLLIKFDKDYTITNISQALLDILEYERDEIVSLNFFKYQKLHITASTREEIEYSTKRLEVYNYESNLLKRSGEELVFSNSIVPEYDSSLNHSGYIVFLQDITSSKKVILQQDKLLSTSRSAAMGEMISMIAHQWRQPLSLINTIMSTLRVKYDLDILTTQQMNSSFKKVEETVHYLSDTIDDFRDYFKPNKIVSDVSVSKLIDKSTTFLIQEIDNLNIKYIKEIDEDIVIKTYKNELTQCIINIFKNSIDAFKEKSIKNGYIRLTIKKEDASISIYLNDNAGGIDKRILKRIFEPYFSTKSKNGTGLGLYMTKKIIEEHLNGKITVTSRNEQTSTLIELPYTLNQ